MKNNIQTFALYGFAILLGLFIYTFIRLSIVSRELGALNDKVATINTQVASTTEKLAALDSTLFKQSDNVLQLTERVGRIDNKVGVVGSTVNTLQKLTQTDPQLLAKYSKIFFLSENYAPERVAEIPFPYRFSQTKAVSVHASVWPFLRKMINDAAADGVNFSVSSGYRPFSEQKNLKSDYTVIYGAGTANQFSADQGYSEHQLGTALDFTAMGQNGELDGFDKTKAYQWLQGHAYLYGFILSYPQNNQFYQFEPWHWRFVGVKLATDLKTQNKNFYDMDQRTIDTYLATIFD